MKVFRTFGFSFILLLTFSVSKAQDSLKWQTYLDLVLESHPLLQNAEFEQKKAKAALLQARGAFDPKVSAQQEYKQYSSKTYFNHINAELKVPMWWAADLKLGYESATGEYLGRESTLPEGGLFYAGISIPVLRDWIMDERRAGVRISQNAVNMAEQERRSQILQLLLDASESYWNWNQSYYRLQTELEGIQIAEIRFQGIKEASRLGKYSAIDTVEALMELQRRKAELYKTQASYRKGALGLSLFLFSENGEALLLKDSIIPEKNWQVPNISLEELAGDLENSSPKILKESLKIKQYEIEKRLYLSKMLPNIRLDFKPILSPINSSYPALNQNYKWGFQMEVPLLFRKEIGGYKKANIGLQMQINSFEFRKRQVNVELSQVFEDLKGHTAAYEAQKENARLAFIMAEAERERMRLGSSTLFYVNYRERYWLDNRLKEIDLYAKTAMLYAKLLVKAGYAPITQEVLP